MKASNMLISTLKEAPQEAKIASHVLLLRAGMMKNQVAGVYQFLPLGLRVLHKIENVTDFFLKKGVQAKKIVLK